MDRAGDDYVVSRRSLLWGASGAGLASALGALRPASAAERRFRSSPGGPLVIEAALNGSTPKTKNPHVPRSVDEIAAAALSCVTAGAAIIHNHNDEPNFGEPSVHSPEPYEAAWRPIWRHHPGLLIHPTTSGDRGAGIEARFSHIAELHRRGALTMASADAGCLGIAFAEPQGPKPVAVFGNSPAEVAWVFRWCREHDVPVHISIFEPGFLRLTLAHLRAGTLPRRSKIQLYFGGEAALFGLPARRSSVEVLLDLLDGTRLPWMAGVLWGDVIGSGLAEFAIRRGGHVRVGLEDYAGPGQPTNEELVDRVAQLGRSLGRKPVDPEDAPGVLWGA